MGAESSTLAEIDSNKFIIELVGSTKKERDDEFWEELLNFTFEAPDDRFALSFDWPIKWLINSF